MDESGLSGGRSWMDADGLLLGTMWGLSEADVEDALEETERRFKDGEREEGGEIGDGGFCGLNGV